MYVIFKKSLEMMKLKINNDFTKIKSPGVFRQNVNVSSFHCPAFWMHLPWLTKLIGNQSEYTIGKREPHRQTRLPFHLARNLPLDNCMWATFLKVFEVITL